MKVISLKKHETRLIEKAAKNNREAQQYIYNRYAPKMLSVCRYYVSDLQYAEDVMITGFFKVFSNLGSFKHSGSFEGWIRRIMVRESISFLRRKKPLDYIEDQARTIPEAIQPENTGLLDADDIQSLIDELPDGYKTVFLMHAIEGYAHKDIAAMLDISESTSKSQLHKARKLLREKIKHVNRKKNGTR